VVRLRLLRILLPALLLPFVLLTAFTFRQRPAALSQRADERGSLGPRAENVELTEVWTASRRLFLRARLGEMGDDGRLRLEGVDRVEVDRERGSPLVLRADRGSVQGTAGHRLLSLEGEVEVRDEPASLALSLPGLELDEFRSEARSLGRVRFQGPGYQGTAAAIRYGLKGEQETLLTEPEVQGQDGSRLTARRASVLERRQEMNLQGAVHVQRGPTGLHADRVHLVRDDEGGLRSADAEGGVSCAGYPIAGEAANLVAETMRIEWDASGTPVRAAAAGAPVLRRGEQQLEASTIEVTARTSERGWRIAARGGVRARGMFDRSPATLVAEQLEGELDQEGSLVRAEAEGGVRFQATDAHAEAARAMFVPSTSGGEITLVAEPGRSARLARGRSRIAARKISTDPGATRITAEGHVEATLLQAPKESPRTGVGVLFQRGDTVHFVAARLEGEMPKGHFVFRGAVRGWQGERSLSGEEVEIRQEDDSLRARTKVSSRFPRPSAGKIVQSDYVEISADALDYSGAERRAVYEGSTTVRMAEGWVEGATLEVVLDDAGKDLRELVVRGSVRFEMRAPDRSGTIPVSGKGDRLVYTPGDHLIRLIGVEGPASVTRSGEQGGTTTGRVLRYRLDTGTLAVEAEERERTEVRSGRQ